MTLHAWKDIRDIAGGASAAAGDRKFVTALARGLEVLRTFTPTEGLLGDGAPSIAGRRLSNSRANGSRAISDHGSSTWYAMSRWILAANKIQGQKGEGRMGPRVASRGGAGRKARWDLTLTQL
jgi:hypothetical protein